MPEYRNRPPLDPATPVWRYLSLEAVVATVRDRKLRFTRVDTFPDPFEGSVPKKQIDDQLPLFAGASHSRMMMTQVAAHYPDISLPVYSEDPWARMTRLRRAKTRAAHASCWAGGEESEALWRLYCEDNGIRGLGVALRTTLGRLETSLAAHDLYVSPVTYRPYHLGPAFNDELDSFMHKRQGFAAEREVRLLHWNDAQYLGLIDIPPSVPDLYPHLFLDWLPGDVIEEIVLSPYADEPYEERARAVIGAADPALAVPVILSELNPRRYAPGF
jgi:hypothetical protein